MFSEEDSNNIFFSIGEFRERKWAQDKNSIFGKNISINIQNRDYKIISMGHRNVQGIFYDDENKVLIMSEHGPRGGDELNINYDIENEIENYGWPISSYGEHYNKNYPRPEAPLHKSHSKYGFIEPIKYWPLSIGVGRVKKVPENFSQKLIGNSFFVASMGWLPRQGHETLYHLVFNEVFNKITEENKILINERIRDIDFDEENKLVYLVLENSPSIAILKIKE
jgi:glucose/arabinose dehydrogenase